MAVTLLTTCVHNTEDLFDKPAGKRIAESLQVYRELLTAQTNGWLVEYYPEKTQKYGGFNLYFRFDDHQVTVQSEIDPAEEATSAWSMGTDMGPTINFDTYNDVLHYNFSDPGVPIGGGYGLNREGDYEFIVESGSADEFILRGKKTGNTIRMTPLPANSWENYSQSLENMKYNVLAPAYQMTVANRDISIMKSAGINAFTLKAGNETIFAPFLVTLTGIKFYEPITVLTETLQVFTYHAGADKMISDQGNAEIFFSYPHLNKYFIDNLTLTDWYLKTENIGPGYLPAWNTMKDNLNDYLGEKLYAMWFGILNTDGPAGISFASYEPGEGLWGGVYVYNFESIGDNRIKLAYNAVSTSINGINADFYDTYSDMGAFTISAFNGKTFIITPDVDITDPKNMTRIKELTLTDVANPDNWITVSLEPALWP